MIEQIKAVVMGLVEGVTEFLPVSSTGHLILAKDLMRFEINDTFEVFIQSGAMLAVILAYPGRFAGLLNFKQREGFAGFRGLWLLFLTSLPAMATGFLLHGVIKDRLFNAVTVALGLGVGAIWILLTEKLHRPQPEQGVDAITWRQALAIGFFQCLALWPGMSRSSSTILGAMLVGLGRRTATEYSFFAAVPVLLLAGFYDLASNWSELDRSVLPLFLTGFVVSFISAWWAVKFFIRFVSRHTLVPFGWYRLAVGGAILLFWAFRT